MESFGVGPRTMLRGLERRRAERVAARVRAIVRLAQLGEGDDDPALAQGHVLDLSEQGVRLQVRRRVPLGARVLVDLECEVPLRVHLGFDADALVVDGPVHAQLVRIAGQVVRSERLGPRRWDAGIEFCPRTTRTDELQHVRCYVDHLRESASPWSC